MSFTDRVDAGNRLAGLVQSRLSSDDRARDPVVLGLPRGGVPVAAAVAAALRAPLDVLVVRKLGAPHQPELAVGAIGEHGARVVNDAVARSEGVTREAIDAVEAAEREELERRVRRYREGRAAIPLKDRTALIVDDGIATGSTARAGCLIARERGAARVVVAVPVAPRNALHRLSDVADELVCLDEPRDFFAVGQFYQDFPATSDDEVLACLRQARADADEPGSGRSVTRAADPEVVFRADGGELSGELVTPERAIGLVLFAHGSGSSRHSPRNRRVAAELNHAGLATFLFDLLTPEESVERGNVFDIGLLTDRLRTATEAARDWLPDLPLGYFGASTGAAATLRAAADPGVPVRAIVCRGGRPDLAGPRLTDVAAPTLLIVGGRDEAVLNINRRAQAQLRCANRLEVIPGATHLFEEPGALEQVADLAAGWFTDRLQEQRGPSSAADPRPAGSKPSAG